MTRMVDDDAGEGELTELIHRVQGAHNACTSLLTSESQLPTCSEFADSTWDEFMAELGPCNKEPRQSSDEEESDQDAPEDIEPPPPRLKNFRDAMECLKYATERFHSRSNKS